MQSRKAGAQYTQGADKPLSFAPLRLCVKKHLK